MKRVIYMLIATALSATSALAHDPKLHTGPKVEGKVISIKGDRLEVGSKDGVVAVTLSPETTYGGPKAARSALKPGQEVMVSGRNLANGEFAAAEVMIHGAGGDESKRHAHDDDDLDE
jgi:hypothetical protein